MMFRNRSSYSPLFFLIILAPSHFLPAQDLSSFREADPLTVGGSASLQQVFFHSQGIKRNRPPYSILFTGNLTVALFGFDIPLSFMYANRQASFHQPFNRFSLTPQYKNLKTYIGNSSLVYSSYTLNGHVFLGAGAEVKINKQLILSAMTGRLQKEIVQTDSALHENQAYKRVGRGVKIAFKQKTTTVEHILFKANDVPTPASAFITGIFPEDNIVMSVRGTTKILKYWELSAEHALSLLTLNTLLSPKDRQVFFHANASTSRYRATKAHVLYQGPFSLGVHYERIDPGYKTLGAYYFNNDIETIKVTFRGSVVKKLSLTSEIGTQRNNLQQLKQSQTKRIASSLSMGFSPNKIMSLQAGYSNFRSFTNNLAPTLDPDPYIRLEHADTLQYRQLSSRGNLNISFRPSPKNSFQLTFTYQDAVETRGIEGRFPGTTLYLSNVSYHRVMKNKNVKTGMAVTHTLQKQQGRLLQYVGPTSFITLLLLDKKLKTSFYTTISKSFDPGVHTPINFILRGNGHYAFSRKHAGSLRLSVIHRTSPGVEKGSSTEFTGTLGYQFKF